MTHSAKESRARELTADLFGRIEDVFYIAVSIALVLGGVILFGSTLYNFATDLGSGPLTAQLLTLLDGLLLVFIITELVHTVRAIIDERILLAEPFLIVGIVAAIRRLIIVSAEGKSLIGKPEFADAMLELGALTASVLALGLTIFLLRRTEHSEPRPAHEPE